MAHDVLIAGALFPDVPSVQFPDSQQQWHSFTDVSDTTAAAADVVQGKQFYDASGTLTQGTASGGGGDDGSFKAVIERSGNIASFPSDITAVGEYAFYNCTGTLPASLPSGVTSIGDNAFNGCTNLAFTSLPSGVTSIGNAAFRNCTNLALTSLPSGVTSIGNYAFEGCTNLALTSLPSGVTSIKPSAFASCTSLALTSLPSGVTSIGSNAFQYCKALTTLFCDGAITSLGTSTFLGNSSNAMALARIEFPNMAANSLGTAFGNSTAANACHQLEVADMGSTKAIAANAFANCYKLQTLVLRRSDAICTLANVNAFQNTPMRGYSSRRGTVYVPSALIETYKTASNWSTIYSAGHLTFAAIEGSEWEL